MCGRTACTLAPDDLCKACRFTDKNGKTQKPKWRNATNGKSYFPSYNIAPGAHTPVLMSSKHVSDQETEESMSSSRVIQPMLWGLIPSWHKGTVGNKAYETNNCRAESMLEKMTYKVPLQKGRRCVILAEGFYEWKRDKTTKQPYYIYFPENKSLYTDIKKNAENKTEQCCVKKETDTNNKHSLDEVKAEIKQEENDEITYPRLLTMAGVFDIWKPSQDCEPVYSYSVITVESSPVMSTIHHRMPALLTTDEAIDDWLNFGDVPLNKASKLIHPVTCIESHPVSNIVNNSRNNQPECIKKIDPSKPKKSAGSLFMSAWLSSSQKVKVESPTKVKVESSAKVKVESSAKVKVESPTKVKVESLTKVKVEEEPPSKRFKVEGD